MPSFKSRTKAKPFLGGGTIREGYTPCQVFIAVCTSIRVSHSLYLSWLPLSPGVKVKENPKVQVVARTGIEGESSNGNTSSRDFLNLEGFSLISCCDYGTGSERKFLQSDTDGKKKFWTGVITRDAPMPLF